MTEVTEEEYGGEAEAGSNLEAGAPVEAIPDYQHIPIPSILIFIRSLIEYQKIVKISLLAQQVLLA